MASVDVHSFRPESNMATRRSHALMRRYTKDLLSTILVTIDFLAIVMTGVAVDFYISNHGVNWSDFGQASLIVFVFYALILNSLGAYQVSSNTNISERCTKLAVAWGVSLGLVVLTAFMFKVSDHYSRSGAILFASFGLAAITAANVIIARQIAKRVKQGVIAFARIQAITLDTPNEHKSDAWVPPMGFEVIADHSVMVSAAGFEDRCRDIRDILQRSIVAGNCDHVVVTSAWKNRSYIEALLQELGPLPAPVFLLSDGDLTKLSRQKHIVLGDRLGFELQSAPLGRIDRAMKRALDIGLATGAIVFLSPLMLLVAIAIRMESGSPVFFSQDRRGFGGVPFKIMKFRTMTVTENGPDIPQAKRGDPRITPFGRILRRTSIDELPQLFNVLKGEMSIVGPRPHAMAHDDHYDQIIERYSFRHHVKPGITGWAQVNGHRGATETSDAMQARIEHDLWYINHWSIWLDVKIILRTAFKVLADTNAY